MIESNSLMYFKSIINGISFISLVTFKDSKIGNEAPIGDAVAMVPPIEPTFLI